MPKLSVIIPCYNTSYYIVRCLDALEHQEFKDFDVFLIDDGSTDNTIKVIEDYAEYSTMKICVIRNSVNSGPAASRKRGIFASNSEFICFCDSDDWYEPFFLQEMVNSQLECNSDIVFCSYRLVFDSGKCKERLNFFEKEDIQDRHRALINAPDSLCLMMIRRTILIKVPHPNMRNGEDMALIPLLISQASVFSVVNKCMYNYYCRGNSASMMPSMKTIESLEASFSFIDQYLPASYQEEKEYIGIRNLLYGALINLFKFTYDKRKANQIVNDFEVTFPFWYANRNMKQLPLAKRVFLGCVKRRVWFFARAISRGHSFLLR